MAATLPASSAFELGEIKNRAAVASALIRVAHGIANGSIDVRRGRLLTEALRAAMAAAETFGSATEDEAPLGGREPTDDELAYVREHGMFPPGVTMLGPPPKWWVTGTEWRPPPPPPAPDETDPES
ncbi:MAG TPA: hypothetical protein VMT03_02040 [Polyangia bacterium]|nr:hypothetical protein [Polyangia bacterium]